MKRKFSEEEEKNEGERKKANLSGNDLSTTAANIVLTLGSFLGIFFLQVAQLEDFLMRRSKLHVRHCRVRYVKIKIKIKT